MVVLNDNGACFDCGRTWGRCRATSTGCVWNPKLWHAREGVEGGLARLPGAVGAAFEKLGPQLKESLKAFWAPGLWWEELDWAYMRA